MFINSSSSRNIVPTPISSFNSSISYFYSACQQSRGTKIIHTLYSFINVVLFMLYVFVLFVGFQRWRRHHSSPAGTTMTHTDFFTYNMMIVDIVGVFGSVLFTSGTYFRSETALLLGSFLFCFTYPGQTLFHVLTCVERYVAVVHPVAYMHMREALKVRIRNISTVAVWLLTFGWLGIYKMYLPDFPTIPFLLFLVICIFVIFFCCLSVLWVLTRPRPGDVVGKKGTVDPSKQRAFQMTSAISVTLLMRVVGLLVGFGIDKWISVHTLKLCLLMDAGIWLAIPSCLVLPLLFLKRAGKLSGCRKSSCFCTSL